MHGCCVCSATIDAAKAWDNDNSTFATMSTGVALWLDQNYTDVIGVALNLHALAPLQLGIYGLSGVPNFTAGNIAFSVFVKLDTLGWWYSRTYNPPVTVRRCSLSFSWHAPCLTCVLPGQVV